MGKEEGRGRGVKRGGKGKGGGKRKEERGRGIIKGKIASTN